MYSVHSSNQPSFFSQKKNQLRKEIRRQELDAFFSSKRNSKLIQEQTQTQKLNYLANFTKLLQQFFVSQSQEEAKNIIKAVWEQLTKDDVNFTEAILLQPGKLLKLFIIFPYNRYAILILQMIMENCYESTFGQDDDKFGYKLNENFLEIKIDRKEMTECQEALDVLMYTIHTMIPELQHRRPLQSFTSMKEYAEAKQNNLRIERKVKIYMFCLAKASMSVNSFVIRFQYVRKYASIWSKWLLLDYKFCEKSILAYLVAASKFTLPFQSLSKESKQMISQQQQEIEQNLLYRLFRFCAPESEMQDSDYKSLDVMAIHVIESIFSDVYIKVGPMVKFFEQIMRLLRLVMIKRSKFHKEMVTKMFWLISRVIQKLNYEEKGEQISNQERKAMEGINIVEIFKNYQLLNTFRFYLKTENWSYKSIFSILCGLIEYCVAFNIPIQEIIGQDEILIEICHKISYDENQIMEINMKSLGMICRYAQILSKDHIFSKIINYGVPEALQTIAYSSKDKELVQQALQYLESYFNEEKIDYYIRMEEERYKHKIQEEEFSYPDRRQAQYFD